MIPKNSIDIETYGSDVLTPYCFAVVYSKKKVVFYGHGCVGRAMLWIFNNSSTYSTYYAHNLTFDGNILLDFLPPCFELCKVNTILKRGEFYSLCLIYSNKRIFFKCSAKILPLPLDDIGYIFNIGTKQVVDHSYANSTSIEDAFFKEKIIRYCANDALLVVRFLEKIFFSVRVLSDLNNVYSISGLSLKIFNNNFNNFKISLVTSKTFDDLVRPSYYGGRCEVFGNLKDFESCYHFDFSGMYTNRLLEEYPYGDYSVSYSVRSIEPNSFYFVSVFSDMPLPILPYRDPSSGKLLFPNGFFSGLYWYDELRLFIDNGGVINDIYYSISFPKSGFVFKDFGSLCASMRGLSKHEKILWKLIPNSFIGRLGLKSEGEETIIIDDAVYDPTVLDVICDKKINKKWIVRVRVDKGVSFKKGDVSYPSVITSKARVLWWRSAKEVIKRGGRLLYCDTDSIFAAFSKDVSPLGERHGEVFWDPSKSDTCLDDACFVSSKLYCVSYDNKCISKIKGVSRKYLKDLDMVSFKKSFFGSELRSFKTLSFERTKMNIKISELNKMIDFSFYDKRVFNEDKTETSSLVLK